MRPGGHEPFVGSDEAEKGRHLPAPQQYAAADPRYAPVSPRSVKSGGLLDKMKTIAPGPFDARPQSPPKLEEAASSDDILAALPTTSNIKGHHARSSTTSSLRSHSSKASSSSSNYTVATQVAKPVINPGGYTAFSPGLQNKFPKGEESPRAHLGAGSRSNTFPNLPTQQSFNHPRRPSESFGLRPSNVRSDNNEELDGDTFVRTSPPREAGRRNPSISGKPPPARAMSFSAGKDVSAINLAAEFGASNPYHTSTISQSSNGTDESRTSKISSRSSPPSSIEPQTRRKPSVSAGLNVATKDLQQAVKQEPLPLSNAMSPPRKEFESSRTVTTPPTLDASMLAPESPMDPMISGGRLSPMPQEAFPSHSRGLSGPPRQPPNQGPPSSNQPTRGPQPQGPQQRNPPPHHRPPPNRGPAPPGAPQYGLPSRPNAPLMQQNGFPPPRRPSQTGPPQNGNKGPPLPQQYVPYRSPTVSTFPHNQQNPPHPQGPPRRPSYVNIPSPHNEFPPGRRPSHTTLPTPHFQSPHLPSPGQHDPNLPHRTPGGTPNGNRAPQSDYFHEGRRPSQVRPLQPPPIPTDTSQRPTTSGSTRPTTAKGDCRGCSKPITGKSVSSADGRLTGRYHKECFVCKTCSAPFPSAEFYVIRDSPYCEEHYHRLNNSVCARRECGRGIEGPFLETERRAKFHPDCLRCGQCKEVLRGDYYEVRGGVFCERDAQRQMQMQMGPRGGRGGRGGALGVGMSRMEKRSTRLMMM